MSCIGKRAVALIQVKTPKVRKQQPCTEHAEPPRLSAPSSVPKRSASAMSRARCADRLGDAGSRLLMQMTGRSRGTRRLTLLARPPLRQRPHPCRLRAPPGWAASRRAANQNALRRQIVLNRAPPPSLERRMARHCAHALWQADRNALCSAVAAPARIWQPVPMLAPISTGWPALKRGRQAFIAGGACDVRKACAFAVHNLRGSTFRCCARRRTTGSCLGLGRNV